MAMLALTVSASSYADVFTASNSGDFTSSSTWAGGIVPPTILLLDQIEIPSGISVNMNTNIEINGLLATMNVDGSVTSSNASALTLTLGSLTGDGSIVINAINVTVPTAFNFTGDLTVNTLNSALGFQSTADIVVNQNLGLVSGTLTLLSGGSLDLASNGTITITGGLLSLGLGGTVGLVSDYNVIYSGVSALSGVELTGSGLRDVTVDVSTGNSVTLTSDLTVGGTLTLASGTLLLSGNDLAINGMVAAAGNGAVASTVASDISINSPVGTGGTIRFTNATTTVNDFIVNVGASNEAKINGFLTVNGTMQLNSGILNFQDTELIVDGAISGSGKLSGNTGSDLTISSSVGAASAIDFTPGGQLVSNLTVAVGTAVAVSLASNLSVQGELTLANGSYLDLNSHMLTLTTTSSLVGSGAFVATADASLIINSVGGIANLRVMGEIGDITINSNNESVALGRDLTVDGTLYLQSGMLVLNNHDMAINANISALGSGSISSTATSNIAVSGTVSPNGSLNFTEAANTVGNFRVSMFNNSEVGIGTDLHVAGTLNFVSGQINAGSHMLTIDASGDIVGQGSGSYVITGIDGSLERSITAGASTVVVFPVGTATNYAPARISLAAGSTSGRVNVGVMPGVMAQGTAGTDLAFDQALVNATWNIESSVSSNLDLNLQVMWSAAMEVNGFNRTSSHITHHANGAWDSFTSANATLEADGMYSMQRDGISSLSPFAVFDQSTTTAVDEVTNAILFDVYPNPTTDQIVVRNTLAKAELVNVEIFNATGQLMGTYRLNDATTTIAVTSLIPGNYFIKFFNATMNTTQTFIKM